MSDPRDDETIEMPHADRVEQQRDALEEPADPEDVASEPGAGGVEADAADVADQARSVPPADEEREGR
ncbi:hypothetical protein ACFWHT_08265 [Microbacterium sp. NPDC058342]|uniref:hypothetical protein n=1 Tax=Microbacterium sp. NPDC058342 TaxID=3346454 RepID=UPI00366581BB